jgi:mono/diheme cytochrome c family protein
MSHAVLASRRPPARPRSDMRGDEQKFGQILDKCLQQIERILSRRRPNGFIRAAEEEGGGQVKEISIFVLGLAMACASAAADAQDLTAGKTPAQLFGSDCAECHRSPSSVAGTLDVRALAGFLREHYTTKSETAGALAAYVSSFAGTVRNRGTGVAAPASGDPPPARRRNRGEDDATADARSTASPIEGTALRHRRSSIAGDAETRRPHNDEDILRPPGAIAATPASAKSNARTRNAAPGDASAPVSRLRRYSAHESESAKVEAGKTPRGHKHRNAADDVVPRAPGVRARTKANDVPTASDLAPGTPPRQGNVSAPPAAPLASTPPRVEQ